ncbi:MAG: AI-2E family transporter [Elusimicrobiota bacterium]
MKKNISFKEIIFPGAVLFLILIVFYFARKTFFTLLLSVAFSYLLNPVVRFFEVRGIKRIYTVSLMYAVVGLLFTVFVIIVFNLASVDVESFINNWPVYYSKFENIFTSMVKKTVAIFPFLAQFKLNERILNFLALIPGYIISFLPSLMMAFIIPFVSFFILIKGDNLLDILVDHIPSRYVEIVFHIVSRIDDSLGNYLRGIMTEAFILFIISFFGLFFIGIDYFSIIAIIVGLSSIVPYLGAFVGAVVSSIIAYLQYNEIYSVLKVILFFITIRFIDDWFLQPYIMKRNVNISPAVVVLSLMAGGEIAGFWGVVFAVPVVCILREVIAITIELHETEFRWKPQPEVSKINIPYT